MVDSTERSEARSQFRRLLGAATLAIDPGYFMLTHAGAMGEPAVSRYRERAYCYELYHQLRVRWPRDFRYSLGGEPDKRSHPHFVGSELSNVNPDMIVHQPGSMSGNLCALEIKPANAALARMRNDIQTLNAFVNGADYTFAILLIYGNPDMLSQTDLEGLSALCGDNTEVWWHPGAGRSAKPVAGTMETAAAARVAPQRAQGSAVAMRRHVPYWSPDPYAPLDDPRWEEQVLPQVRARVRALLARHAAGEIDWADFTEDRKSADGGWGLRMCLWSQHHKNDQRHKNLGRPFWSVEAFRNWVTNIESLPPAEVRDRRGAYTQRTIEKFNGTKLGAFLRHEHVVPKKVMIDWLVREPGRVDEILAKNVCCVITRAEDSRLARDTHPDPANPWRRYEGTGIRLLFNPDWPDEVVTELTQHGLLTDESYEPFGEGSQRYRIATDRPMPGGNSPG